MTGSALAVIGQVLLTRLSPHGNYAGEIVPSLILTGLGVSCLFCSAIFGDTVSVKPGVAGIAGALVNTSLQIGGSVGATVLSLVFASSVAGYEASHAASRSLAQDAAIHGYAAAFWWAAGLSALGFLVATFIIPRRTATPVSQPAAPEPKRHQNHDGLPESGPPVTPTLSSGAVHHDHNIPSRSPTSAYRRDTPVARADHPVRRLSHGHLGSARSSTWPCRPFTTASGSQSALAWVVDAYLIGFGALLMLAGRLGDLLGRRRVFLVGLVVFTLGSLWRGLSGSQIAARHRPLVQAAGAAATAAVLPGMIVHLFRSPTSGPRR